MPFKRLIALGAWLFLFVLALHAQYARIANAGAAPNGAMVAPTVIQSTLPAYTEEATTRGIDGVVTLETRLDSRGNVEVLRVLKGLGYGLDENATAAVRNWVFSPALRNGVPVDVISQVDVLFNLRAAKAFRVGGGVTTPIIIQRVEPEYTPAARGLGIQGTVILQALITKDGSVEILRVIHGVHAGLTDSAIDALRQWRFKPGTRTSTSLAGNAGEPVDISLNIEVNFHLPR